MSIVLYFSSTSLAILEHISLRSLALPHLKKKNSRLGLVQKRVSSSMLGFKTVKRKPSSLAQCGKNLLQFIA